MILLFFDRFSPFFPEPGVFTGSHIFFWDRNNVAVISASHVALWGTSFLREDFLNAFEPLVFYIYVDKTLRGKKHLKNPHAKTKCPTRLHEMPI